MPRSIITTSDRSLKYDAATVETGAPGDHAGEPWNPNTFGTEFARRRSALKLPPVRLHDLRHSFATLMIEKGVDLKTVSQALGHSSIRTTADLYAHVTPAMQQSAAERLDEIVRDA